MWTSSSGCWIRRWLPAVPWRPEESSESGGPAEPGGISGIAPPLDRQAALAEANRCLFCFDAPCTAACPTHIDVPRFIKKIAGSNLRGAAVTILDANILGLSCARVCPVEVLCEGACVLEQYNRKPIEIGRLQRYAMDRFYEKPSLPAAYARGSVGRVACIGGGPASLACAAELRRRGVAVTVFDNRPLPGGLNTYGVAEYKLRPADSLREVELVRAMGVEFRRAEVASSAALDELEGAFDLVFIGVGLGAMERLGLPGEDAHGVIDALRFIERYKTLPDFAVGRRVIVIGGGVIRRLTRPTRPSGWAPKKCTCSTGGPKRRCPRFPLNTTIRGWRECSFTGWRSRWKSWCGRGWRWR